MTPALPLFSSAMQALLEHLRLDARHAPEHEAYTLSFAAEDAVLYCLCGETSWFDVVAEVGAPRSGLDVPELLRLNRPPVAVQLADDGSLLMWGRLPLAGLTPHGSAALVQQVLARLLEVRRCLKCSDSTAS